MVIKHFERRYTDRVGWLRAAVLGANDGILSTESLLVGVSTLGSIWEDLIGRLLARSWLLNN